MAILSTGIKLFYDADDNRDWQQLLDLQEIPDLGVTYDAVEVTTLDDSTRKYIRGLGSMGDTIDFKFLFEEEQFVALLALQNGTVETTSFKVELPSGAVCTFCGSVSVKLDAVGAGAPITYTLSITPYGDMEWASDIINE